MQHRVLRSSNFILPFIMYKVAISELIIINSGIITFICPTAPTFFHTSHTFLVADCNQRTCPALVRSNRTCPANLGVQPCPVRSLICSVQLSSTAQHIIIFYLKPQFKGHYIITQRNTFFTSL